MKTSKQSRQQKNRQLLADLSNDLSQEDKQFIFENADA